MTFVVIGGFLLEGSCLYLGSCRRVLGMTFLFREDSGVVFVDYIFLMFSMFIFLINILFNFNC